MGVQNGDGLREVMSLLYKKKKKKEKQMVATFEATRISSLHRRPNIMPLHYTQQFNFVTTRGRSKTQQNQELSETNVCQK